MTLWLCLAEEYNGERSRLIHFLVRARSLPGAERVARRQLRREWPDPDRRSVEPGMIATFGGGQLSVSRLVVEPITPADAIRYFTRH